MTELGRPASYETGNREDHARGDVRSLVGERSEAIGGEHKESIGRGSIVGGILVVF